MLTCQVSKRPFKSRQNNITTKLKTINNESKKSKRKRTANNTKLYEMHIQISHKLWSVNTLFLLTLFFALYYLLRSVLHEVMLGQREQSIPKILSI